MKHQLHNKAKILTGSGVLQGEVLVLELVAVDGLATSTISGSEVASLAHKVRDDAVKCGPLEPESLLPSTESTEVLASLRNNIRPQLKEK